MRIIVMGVFAFVTSTISAQSVNVLSLNDNFIRPADPSDIGTLTVLEHLTDNKKDRYVPVGESVGFSTKECDFVTAFSAVEKYEQKETWGNDSQTLAVQMGGQSYEGKLRSHGYYPLGLNLACIDLIPLSDKLSQIAKLSVADVVPTGSFTTDANSASEKPIIGYPIVDKYNEVIGIYIDSKTLITGRDITRFLKYVASDTTTTSPHLKQR
jgi:hypothetical protein